LRVSSGRHTQSYSVYYLLLWIWKMAGTWTCTTFFSESGRSPPHESSATLNIHSVYGLMLIRTRLCFCKACICLLSYINASGSYACFLTNPKHLGSVLASLLATTPRSQEHMEPF